jgi:type I restriction enzyme S subunit
MSKEVKISIVPKLRFIEFVNIGEWLSESFTEMYRLISTNSYSRDQLNYNNGSIKNIHYGDIHTKFSTLFDITKENVPFVDPSVSLDNLNTDFFCIESDIVFADASEDLNDVGKSIEIVNTNGEKVLSGMHTILARQRKPKLIIGFGGYLFLSNRIRGQIQKEAQGTKVFGISGNRLANITICYPENKKEQQKIADCLSSLDDLITAENQKLETLKAHKKGLMQNLFPAEGETAPNIRFPEFSEGWKKAKLKDVSLYFNGGSYENDVKGEGKYELITLKSINTNGKLVNSKRYVEIEVPTLTKGTLVMILSEQAPGLLGMTAIIPTDDKYVLNQRVAEIRPNQKVESYFLSMAINRNQNYFSKHGAGTKVQNISKPNVENYEFLLPEILEQQKIASCLSSLDEQIETQSQKIETLKLHKKGLMQGLFPNVNEVSLPNSLSLESVRN